MGCSFGRDVKWRSCSGHEVNVQSSDREFENKNPLGDHTI